MTRPRRSPNGRIELPREDVSISPPPSVGLMWSFSERSRQMSLSHAELEGTIVERTEEAQNLSQRLLNVHDEERRRLARNLHDSTG